MIDPPWTSVPASWAERWMSTSPDPRQLDRGPSTPEWPEAHGSPVARANAAGGPLLSSTEGPRYSDRLEAGRTLASAVQRVVSSPCVVAGVPRGGLIVASVVARHLGAPLTCLHARKLSADHTPDTAFGALDEEGFAVLDYPSLVSLGVGTADVGRIKAEVMGDFAHREGGCPHKPLHEYLPGRTVVLVDDGLATSIVMQAAIAYAARHGAEAIVVAVPCASGDAAHELESLLRRPEDHFVCPRVDEDFRGVGSYYADFRQVADAEVMAALRSAAPAP